ncbi:MAG: hypothetical protein K9M81_02100 [Chthoniobacterales bacterium]|nr:hypothetical protein [Chthoniobacterales bacterium]
MKSVPPDSRSPLFVSRDTQSELEKGLPVEQSSALLNIRNVTEEGASYSFLYSCLRKLWRSIYNFFSYVSSCFTFGFSKNSFQNVTRNQNTTLEILDDQKKAALILKEYFQKERIVRHYGGVYEKKRRFYVKQKDFFVNYLQYLQNSVVTLNNIIQSKTEEIGVETEPSVLIPDILKRLQFLKKQSEYQVLANDIENRLLLERRLENGASIFSAKALSTTIELNLERLSTKQHSNDRLQEQLKALYNKNQDFLSMAHFDDPNFFAHIHVTMDHAALESLETLNDENLETLRTNNKKSEAGFENNMLVFQNDIQIMVNRLQGALNAISEKKALEESRAYIEGRRESRIRGGGPI